MIDKSFSEWLIVIISIILFIIYIFFKKNPIKNEWKFRKSKYKKDYNYNFCWSFWTFVLLIVLVFFLIIPYFNLSEQEKSFLEWSIAIISVIFSIFLQKFIDILIGPMKDDMLFIDDVKTAYDEIFMQLEELKNDKNLKYLKITLVLNMPIIFEKSEIDKILKEEDVKIKKEEDVKTKFVQWIEKIANNKNYSIEIVTLPFWQKNSNSISPVELYIKEYVSHEIHIRNETLYQEDKEKFYEQVKYLRMFVIDNVFKFYNKIVIEKKHENIKILESNQNEFFWQCALFKSRDKHLYKSIVTFVGSEYYKINSPSVNFLKDNDDKNISISGGFISDNIEKYEWVEKTLIGLYKGKEKEKEITTHPIDSMVNKIIANEYKKNISIFKDIPQNKNSLSTDVISNIKCSDIGTSLLYPNRLLYYPLEDIKTLWHRYKIQNFNLEEKKNILIFGSNIGEKIIPIIYNKDINIHLVDRNPISLFITTLNILKNIDTEQKGKKLTISFVDDFLKLQSFNMFKEDFKNQQEKSIEFLKNRSKGIDSTINNIYKKLEDEMNILKENFDSLKDIFNEDTEFSDNSYDAIIIDLPLVEDLSNKFNDIPSLYLQFYDNLFIFKKNVLEKSLKLLKRDKESKQKKYEKPFVSVTFSSLEDIKIFEEYLDNIGYDILYKESVYEQKIEWIHYYLLLKDSDD